MNCMKCGREIEEGQAFCPDCLSVMERYPVKPGTVVQIPKRKQTVMSKRIVSRRKQFSPEEQIRRLRRLLRNALIAWFITFLLLGAALYPAVLYLLEENHFGLGQNYSVITPAEETDN